MKFETLMLQSLFAACLLICLMALGSMLVSPAPGSHFAASQAPVTTTTDATR